MSKGSWRRPSLVPKDVQDKNYDRIFRKKESTDNEKPESSKSKGKTKSK